MCDCWMISAGAGNPRCCHATAVSTAPARRALQETLLDQIGFDNVFNRIARLGQARRNGFDPDRPTAKIARNNIEIAPVKLVEAAIVHPSRDSALIGYSAVYDIRAATSAKSRTRRKSRPAIRGVPRERRQLPARRQTRFPSA